MTPPDEAARILIVDDEQNIRDGCARILSRMDHRVQTAGCGEEAIEVLQREEFSIVLLDLKMPGMGGMAAMQRVHALNPAILVIVITGYATLETAIEAMKQGAYDFIPKPFQPEQLRIVVTRAVEKLRLTREAQKLERERQRTLFHLALERSRTRTIIDSLPTGVVVTNADGTVVMMNPAFRFHLGLEPLCLPGNPVGDYVPDTGFCDLVTEVCQGRARSVEEAPPYEFCPEEGRWLQARARPVLGDDASCLGAVVNVMDITTIKRLDHLKSEFVAKVSHELRSPLSTIHEQLALALREMAKEESKNEQYLLSRAKAKTQGLISLIGDLLDLSRIESGSLCKETQPVALDRLLSGIVEFLHAKAAARRQTLTLELPDDPLPEVMADPIALESVFGNLITNAINYTPDGGRISVGARLTADGVTVTVRDSGMGIAAEHQEKIFERFYRVRNAETRFITGTGLGLPIVKGLLEDIGGTIALESEVGRGSVFTVRLPVA